MYKINIKFEIRDKGPTPYPSLFLNEDKFGIWDLYVREGPGEGQIDSQC